MGMLCEECDSCPFYDYETGLCTEGLFEMINCISCKIFDDYKSDDKKE